MHHDDNYDGRIDFSEIAPNSLEFNSYEECESACKNAKIQACRYTDEGACLYDLKVDKIVTNVVRILGPLYYECEIINDGNAQFWMKLNIKVCNIKWSRQLWLLNNQSKND